VPIVFNLVVDLEWEGGHLSLQHCVWNIRFRVDFAFWLTRLGDLRWILRWLELSFECAHDIYFAALGPQHIGLVLLVVEQPPVAHFKECPYQHW